MHIIRTLWPCSSWCLYLLIPRHVIFLRSRHCWVVLTVASIGICTPISFCRQRVAVCTVSALELLDTPPAYHNPTWSSYAPRYIYSDLVLSCSFYYRWSCECFVVSWPSNCMFHLPEHGLVSISPPPNVTTTVSLAAWCDLVVLA